MVMALPEQPAAEGVAARGGVCDRTGDDEPVRNGLDHADAAGRREVCCDRPACIDCRKKDFLRQLPNGRRRHRLAARGSLGLRRLDPRRFACEDSQDRTGAIAPRGDDFQGAGDRDAQRDSPRPLRYSESVIHRRIGAHS